MDSRTRTDVADPEIPRLVAELKTHQIELELQNEELRQTQQQLVRARDELVDLYDRAPVGYVTANDAGLVLEANLRPLIQIT